MNNKRILFIDDGDITEQIEKLRGVLRKVGITLIETFFDINQSKYRKQNPNDSNSTILNFDAIKDEFKVDLINIRFDHVLCDFNFNDEHLNGFILIKWLKNVARSYKYKMQGAKFSLYSSERDKSLKTLFNEEDISKLIKLKLEDFYDRTRISEDFATSVINSNSELNLKEILIRELLKHKEKQFRSVYPKFIDFTLENIVLEIEKDTHNGRIFQESFIELTVAHMIQLNEK